MDVTEGSQQALQIAFQTLKDRCKQFQHHIAALEAENVKLRVQQVNQTDSDSLSEADVQKRRIRELSEQNVQLHAHLKIVSDENQQLWTKLSKLSEVNKSLGTHLTRINDTLSQKSTKQSVIRSKTFTIDDAAKKLQQKNLVDENEKVSLELEDISLKLINNIAKEKMELELQCSQMMEIQNSNFILGSGAATQNENGLVDTTMDEYLQNFSTIKYVLLEEKNKLLHILKSLEKLSSKEESKSDAAVQTTEPLVATASCETSVCDKKEAAHSSSRPDQSVKRTNKQSAPPEEDSLLPDISDIEKICPVCSLAFSNDTTFLEFQNHVVEHFIADDQPEYEVL